MIHKYNIAELALVDRPVKGPATGFGSVTKKHNSDNNKIYRETSYCNAHGYKNPLIYV
jgi:hypothetical protein